MRKRAVRPISIRSPSQYWDGLFRVFETVTTRDERENDIGANNTRMEWIQSLFHQFHQGQTLKSSSAFPCEKVAFIRPRCATSRRTHGVDRRVFSPRSRTP